MEQHGFNMIIDRAFSESRRSFYLFIFVLFIAFFQFIPSCYSSEYIDANKLIIWNANAQSRWSYTLQVGWATNIDFTLKSISKEYKFNNNSTGINSRFYAYDSREKILELEGDQANNYLITVQSLRSGLIITSGVIHDKREQKRNSHGNSFKYQKGGLSPLLLLGFQHDFNADLLQNFSVQLKSGGFVSFNKIDADLVNGSSNKVYKANSRRRRFAGGGMVSMVVVSYQYSLSETASISFLVNGTMMNGKALTNARVVDESTDQVDQGKLSVMYSSFSIGPSLGFTFMK